jgi:cob(I)alamin adenosyltransferase
MPFTFQMTAEQKELCAAEQKAIFNKASAAALLCTPCLLVMDEIIDVLVAGLLEQNPVEDFLYQQKHGPEAGLCEIVLTGHKAPQWLVEYADYVTEFKKIKHPYDTGTPARKGVEF